MSVTHTEFQTPIPSDIIMLDLHVGCVQKPDNGRRAVAIMLQPPDKLLSEDKFGYVLDDWAAVWEVINGLIDQAGTAWGDLIRKKVAQTLYLGLIAGSLADQDGRDSMREAINESPKAQAFAALLHEKLSAVLADAGLIGPNAVTAHCAECGAASTSNSMYALYCVECIQGSVGAALLSP